MPLFSESAAIAGDALKHINENNKGLVYIVWSPIFAGLLSFLQCASARNLNGS
ncbi:hypothetical protein VIBC2010_06689 [Vibrio caribbeanicus ATCC BAA-2122]|uniref:Uncharacterized protein n=1 Tax=Vibrio caribbeanicus ATCC BAA-2122 TaxID=796620 RepID=E3BIJ5_9VIBR|nr:hypothetical protein VIBC2010_06689 [Vibrio caribbeanicus ATCC BAA-2122]